MAPAAGKKGKKGKKGGAEAEGAVSVQARLQELGPRFTLKLMVRLRLRSASDPLPSVGSLRDGKPLPANGSSAPSCLRRRRPGPAELAEGHV